MIHCFCQFDSLAQFAAFVIIFLFFLKMTALLHLEEMN